MFVRSMLNHVRHSARGRVSLEEGALRVERREFRRELAHILMQGVYIQAVTMVPEYVLAPVDGKAGELLVVHIEVV